MLHFKKNITTFKKSDCKEGNKSIDCGTGNHVNDCYGTNCVSGHLKTRQYLPSYSKNATASFFSSLHSNIYQAIENAAWLRYQILKNKPNTPIYELNPYTNMDKLARHLLQIQEEVVWIDFNEKRNFEGIIVEFFQKSATEIELILTNETKATYLFLPTHVYLKKQHTQQNLGVSKTLIRVGETRIIWLNVADNEDFQVCFVFKSYCILLA